MLPKHGVNLLIKSPQRHVNKSFEKIQVQHSSPEQT